jgi:hypothetical protein
MTELVRQFGQTALATLADLLPVVAITFGFQYLVIRRPMPHLGRLVGGFAYVLLGLTCLLMGLEQGLFPLGKLMAEQLTAAVHGAAGAEGAAPPGWGDYRWVYAFAVCLGFATTVAEPALLAVAMKAREVSGGSISIWGLRIAVALGVAGGVGLGVFRIVTGTPIYYYIVAGYALVILQTLSAPRLIVPLAFDSGGVATSTISVPLVTAMGLGLAGAVPGRSPALDGFGLVAFACLFPIMTVMGYAQIAQWVARRGHRNRPPGGA